MEIKKQNVRTLSLIVCTFTYLLVGAAMFDALESTFERERRIALRKEEKEIRTTYNISFDDYAILKRNVMKTIPYYSGVQWKFAGSLFFSLTVVTTIGYGHSTPQTVGGKIVCMLYALAGIPLCIIMFQSVGERLNVFVTYLLKQIKKCFKMKNSEVSETNVILVTMNLSTIVLTSGALLFSHYEGWNLVDAFYYCFITLTTIGFGDFVALQKGDSLQKNPQYVAMSMIFILFGLTVISAAMNLLVLRFLTMNTEDERRDELEAAAAAQNAVRLDGDVITSNGNVVSNAQERPEQNEIISVCSCSCYKWRSNREKVYDRHSQRKISNFYSGKSGGTEEMDSFIPVNYRKRTSL
ncbi:hypothetical protein CHS0354_007530 [Potamilus streckersoni]|uniref:Potassium channel domain-containing protein n=1 Tax=Potamilus streckersoni TaxID=2493646 RepID=A0AAE0RLX6_9BIVA|nr:hypothetical protein CHS0354_007530 [Potamilus streckersoni]